MALEQSYPLFALGPFSDLNWGYLRATINNTTVTVLQTAARKSGQGFNLVRTTNGVYTISHPKTATCMILPVWRPVQASGARSLRILSAAVPTDGTAILNISAAITDAATDPSAEANELDLLFLLGGN